MAFFKRKTVPSAKNSVKNLFLDIGDIYTKLIATNGKKNVEYDMCFPTIAKQAKISRPTCSYYKKSKTESYIVGWDAAYKCSYREILETKARATIFEVLNKTLFDYFKDQSKLNLNFFVDDHDELHQVERLEELFKSCKYAVSGYINGVHLTKHYKLNINHHPTGDVLKNYLKKKLEDKDMNMALVVDFGFKKTKLFMLDYKHDHVTTHKLAHGFDYYLKKVSEYFYEEGIRLHPFVILKELERSNTKIESLFGKYDVSKIIQNIRFDLNRVIVNEIETILNKYYQSYIIWPEFLYITGGGAHLNGDIIKFDLSERFEQFKETEIEQRPRDYLVRKYLELI